MTFDEVWKALVTKRPALAEDDTKVEFQVKNLKKLLQQMYDQGASSVPKKTPAERLMRDFFRGKF